MFQNFQGSTRILVFVLRLNVLPINKFVPQILYQLFYQLPVGFRVKLQPEKIFFVDKTLVLAYFAFEEFYCACRDFEGVSMPHECNKLGK